MQTNRNPEYIIRNLCAHFDVLEKVPPYTYIYSRLSSLLKYTRICLLTDVKTYTSSMHAYQKKRKKRNFFLYIFALFLCSFKAFLPLLPVVFTNTLLFLDFRFFSQIHEIAAMCTVLFVKIRTPCYNFSDVKLPAGDVSLIKMTCKEPISARVAA